MEGRSQGSKKKVAHMLPFPDGASISTGSVLPDEDILLNRDCAQAKGGFINPPGRGP